MTAATRIQSSPYANAYAHRADNRKPSLTHTNNTKPTPRPMSPLSLALQGALPSLFLARTPPSHGRALLLRFAFMNVRRCRLRETKMCERLRGGRATRVLLYEVPRCCCCTSSSHLIFVAKLYYRPRVGERTGEREVTSLFRLIRLRAPKRKREKEKRRQFLYGYEQNFAELWGCLACGESLKSEGRNKGRVVQLRGDIWICEDDFANEVALINTLVLIRIGDCYMFIGMRVWFSNTNIL